MKYLAIERNKRGIYHHSIDGEQPLCHTAGNFVELDADEIDGLDVCCHCATGQAYNWQYDKETLTEQILDAIEDDWLGAADLAKRFQPSRSVYSRRLAELYEAGEIYRRGGIKDTNGGKGYQFSQQEPEQVTHEPNNQLFESMLAND